jgi:hypothetical protein
VSDLRYIEETRPAAMATMASDKKSLFFMRRETRPKEMMLRPITKYTKWIVYFFLKETEYQYRES